MSYASILVHVDANSASHSRLACARAAAERFGATLIGLGAEMVPPMAAGPVAGPITAEYYTAMNETVEKGLVAAKAVFATTAAGLPKTPVWETVHWFPGEAMAAAARSADLIVTGRAPKDHNMYRDASAAELVLASGRPVLIAPSKAPPLAAKRVLFAWKDTREARRAMSDAMPFFEKAEAVLVFAATSDDEIDAKAATDDVVAALKRHGAAAEAKVEVRADFHGADLIDRAARFGADLIVAGGYGHSRLGEWAFGGVTRDLLFQDDAYVVLSH
ncbi:MAG: universal stress protein [Caulobacteraceae bacterium]